MEIERYQNLNADEKAAALQTGAFTRDGLRYGYWRTSCHGEAWFKSDEAAAATFPEIHGSEPSDDDDLDPTFRAVLKRMEAAGSDDERSEIWTEWLLGDWS